MKDVNTGYKLVALVAVSWAVYSCNSSVDSQERGTSAQHAALREAIDALTAQVSELVSRVDTRDGAGCSTADFLEGSCAFPDDASMSTTFCFSQGRALDLSGKFAVEANLEFDGGAGWPNVLWAKANGKVTAPFILSLPPFVFPTEIAGQAGGGLGRGVDICVDVPIVPDDGQKALLADLVTGVNIESGIQAKYRRRANRLLNFAALRTPVAQPNLNAPGANTGPAVAGRSAEDADDAFDVADDAVERFMANAFQPQVRATDIMADPIFRDLAASVDLPEQVAMIIADPQQILGGLQSVTAANACSALGVDASLRSRFPDLNAICTRIAGLPSDGMLKTVGSNVSSIQNRVNDMYTATGLRNFVCNNVTLAALSPDC